MPRVTVLGYGSFEVAKGKKLVLALEDNGINILHRCGGKAKCTTCRVEVLEGEYCDLTTAEKNAYSCHRSANTNGRKFRTRSRTSTRRVVM